MLQQPKQRQSQSAAKLRKCEQNGKTLSLNVNGGRVFKTSDRPRTRPVAHLYGSHRTRTAAAATTSAPHPPHGYRLGHQQAPPSVPRQDLQMTPLTVPLLPHVPPRPILTQRTPPPLRSSRVYSGRRASPGRPSAPPPGQAQLTAQIQLLRPNNTPVSVEKVDLDRRGLTSWPNLGGGEEPVRLLSLQHNLLTRVDPPSPVPSLVLLDLYHNHLHNLHGLHSFPNLRVLMLAKNRLSRLDGLEHLTKLEVLDLHGNQLHHVQGLAHLKELRLLNLAGNMLRHVNGLRGLDCLVELNLRRNLIRTVADLHYLPRLEKVFMGYNEIYRYEDLACLQNCLKLRELSLEENPISRQPHYFHHTVARFYRLKRLDDQELTMETRRQSEKVLQKAKEKERAQATRISDEEKRNSAITNAMKNWQVLKRQHRKLVRKPSESSNSASDQPPSKDSDGTTSSGFCGDTVSDVGEEEEEEGKKESAEEKDEAGEEAKADGTKENDSQKGSAAEVVEEQQQQEDDRASLASSATSSGISDVSLVHRATKQRLTEAPQQPAVPEAEKAKEVQITSESVKKVTKKAPAKCVDKTNLPRSKSYTDMRILRRKPSFEEDNSGRVKVARTPEVQRGGCEAWGGAGRGNEKISLEAAPRGALPVQNVPVARRGVRLGSPRAAEKVVPRIIANESSKQGRGSPKNFELLKKSEATRGAGQLPDKVVSAAITRVRSNLSLPVQSPEVPVSPRNAISEPSEIDSSSDAESAATATTTNTAGTPTSSVEPPPHPTASRGPHSLADLRVPLTRPREQERPTSEKADKAVPAVGQSSTGILREQGPNFLAELEGERLSLYGQGALRCTDLAWEKSMAAAATTARFQYINFDDIVDIFPKLRVKFPRLENFIFVETHLAKCSQLNALAELHQVTSLEVGKEGNPLTQIPYWRLYAVFRLSHWGLRLIDGVEVSEEERTDAAVMFSHLSQLAFTCLPRDQLAAFLSSHHHHHGHHHAHPAGDHDPTSPPPGGGGTQDTGGGAAGREEDEGPRLNLPHLQDLIGKEALQYRPAARLTQAQVYSITPTTSKHHNNTPEPGHTRQTPSLSGPFQKRRKEDNATLVSAGRQARQLAVWTFDSLHRLHTHHATWPSVLHDLVRDAVTDLAKPTYGKQCLEDVKRTLGWKK